MMLSFYLWTLVIIGRPQDIFPELLFQLHPGKVVALLTLLLYFLDIKKRVNKNIFQKPEVVAFLLFFLLMAASGLCGVYPGQSWKFLKDDFFKLAIYFLVLNRILTTPKDIRKLAWIIVWSAAIIALASLSVKTQIDRVSVGTMYDPNDLAMLLVISFPFVLYFFLERGRGGLRKVILAGVGAVILSAFVLTQSRGGFLGLMAIILTFAFSNRTWKDRWSKGAVILILALALLGMAGNQYWQRIQTIVSREDRGSMREVIWGRGLKLFARNLWIGVGPGCFSTAYGRALEQGMFGKLSILDEANVYDRAWKAAHNSFLQVGTETGISGLLIFLFLIGLSIKNFRETKDLTLAADARSSIQEKPGAGFQTSSASDIRSLAEMFSLGLIGFLVCGFFLSQAYSIFPYLFLAVSGILRRQVGKETAGTTDFKSVPMNGGGVSTNEFNTEGRGLGVREPSGYSPY